MKNLVWCSLRIVERAKFKINKNIKVWEAKKAYRDTKYIEVVSRIMIP